MKQETIEEAAERYVHGGIYLNEPEKQQTEIAFYEGAKWQAKKMYSGEEVIRIARESYAMGRNIVLVGAFNKWLEKFKKS